MAETDGGALKAQAGGTWTVSKSAAQIASKTCYRQLVGQGVAAERARQATATGREAW